MHGLRVSGGSARAAIVVAAATLLAVAFPAVSPLYALVYPTPGSGPGGIGDALTEANLEPRFDADEVTQFETVRFTARLIYGTRTTPELPTVRVAWSNLAELTAQDEEAFVIEPTSASRQFLDDGARRPGGGFQLDWTWDVTPLKPGKQTLIVQVRPTVVVEGRTIPDLADVNQPVPVDVEVNPVQRDFDEVVGAAAEMETDVPEEMTVGQEYDVGASMARAAPADQVSADIRLEQGEGSAEVTITEASAAPGASPAIAPGISLVSAPTDAVERRWTVVPDEPGQVDLVFVADVAGRAEGQALEQAVPVTETLRAVEPGASLWEMIRTPVNDLGSIAGSLATLLALGGTLFALRAKWSKRQPAAAGATPGGEVPLVPEQRAADSGPLPPDRPQPSDRPLPSDRAAPPASPPGPGP